jgi:hypothetical protein
MRSRCPDLDAALRLAAAKRSFAALKLREIR